MTTEERNLILNKYMHRRVHRHYTSKHRYRGSWIITEKRHLIEGNANIFTPYGRVRRNAVVRISESEEYWHVDLRLYSTTVAEVAISKFNNRMMIVFAEIYSRTCISALADFSRWLSDMTVISEHGNPITYDTFKKFAKWHGTYEMLDSSVWFD